MKEASYYKCLNFYVSHRFNQHLSNYLIITLHRYSILFAPTVTEEPVSYNTRRQNPLDISVNEILAMDNFHSVEKNSQIPLWFKFETVLGI